MKHVEACLSTSKDRGSSFHTIHIVKQQKCFLLSIFTADCLRRPIQMAGIETIWELHTLTVMNS